MKQQSKKFNMYMFCYRDCQHPFFEGVYYDAKRRYAVFSDGQILFYSRKYYDEDFAGKCITKDGVEIIYMYPNWFYVVKDNKATKGYHKRKIDFDTVDRIYKESMTWLNANYPKASRSDKEKHALFNIDGNHFTMAKIKNLSIAMRAFGIEELAIPNDVKARKPALLTGEDSGVMVLPVVPMDYENDKLYYVVKL